MNVYRIYTSRISVIEPNDFKHRNLYLTSYIHIYSRAVSDRESDYFVNISDVCASTLNVTPSNDE